MAFLGRRGDLINDTGLSTLSLRVFRFFDNYEATPRHRRVGRS